MAPSAGSLAQPCRPGSRPGPEAVQLRGVEASRESAVLLNLIVTTCLGSTGHVLISLGSRCPIRFHMSLQLLYNVQESELRFLPFLFSLISPLHPVKPL